MPLSKLPPPRRFDPAKFEMNGPLLVCRETTLPAYADKADYEATKTKQFPSFALEKFWRCVWCGRYHAAGYFPRGANNKHLRVEKTLMEAFAHEQKAHSPRPL